MQETIQKCNAENVKPIQLASQKINNYFPGLIQEVNLHIHCSSKKSHLGINVFCSSEKSNSALQIKSVSEILSVLFFAAAKFNLPPPTFSMWGRDFRFSVGALRAFFF